MTPATPATPWGPPPPAPDEPRATIDITYVRAATDVPTTPPAAGAWRVHMIDVGTGLAILIQGHDFNLLYDAGSNDPGETPLRVLDYLARAVGPSGDDLCVDDGAPVPASRRRLDHVVLSHPHFDHASALDEVIHCYDVAHLWDSGAVNDRVFYRELLEVVAGARGLAYHTAAPPAAERRIGFRKGDVTLPASIAWSSFSEGDEVRLGDDARFAILHADGKATRDVNAASVVLAVTLGTTTVLLVGDAESGRRADPSAPPGDVEAHLLERFRAAIDADVLQVGHHGSKTSSRLAFLEAVSPTYALVSAGPRAYGKVTLPDREVLDALAAVGATVLRTDVHDDACPHTGRLGGDRGPGGCDSVILEIGPGRATPPGMTKKRDAPSGNQGSRGQNQGQNIDSDGSRQNAQSPKSKRELGDRQRNDGRPTLGADDRQQDRDEGEGNQG